jgi:prolyl 4-hydroxylase
MTHPSPADLEQAARAGNDAARIELGNRLLSANPYGSPEHERGLEWLKLAAQGPQGAQAQWFLGAYFAQVSVRPDARAQALHWIGRAAEAGMPAAIDRLADIHLAGLGVEPSPVRALQLQQQLADLGFSRAAWEAGYLHSQELVDGSSANAAAGAFARACALGYPPAYYSLGLRFALGAGVARDASFGRALLLRAADGRFPGAREAADELAPASEATGASRWHGVLKANMDAAPLEQLAPGRLAPAARPAAVRQLESHFARIAHPALSIDAGGRLACAAGGDASLRASPAPWQWLGERPRVATSAEFASREECDHLVHKMAESLRRASDYRRGRRANDDAEVLYFSGSGQAVGALGADSVVRVMERRIADMTGWDREALEPCSVIRYEPGEEYQPHVDYFTAEQMANDRAEGRDFGGQRLATFLVYLRAPDAGGETVYERTGLTVAGRRGMAVLHYNVTPDGLPDDWSLHTGRKVRQGEKWLWRSTLREHPLHRQ